jgi:hypothetical protein
MPYRITKEWVWAGVIPDDTRALAEKLQALSAGGLNLDLIISRQEAAGNAVLYVSPLRTYDELDALAKAGFSKKDSFIMVRVSGANAKGLGAKITMALAEAGLQVRAFTGAALGDQHVTNITFGSNAEADHAKAVLERLFAEP